jgi:ActR/RegA family two-component response regulator
MDSNAAPDSCVGARLRVDPIGYAAVDSAVEAIKLGAREYLTRPFDF